MSRINAHQSPRSESVDWLTPPDWIERLGPFDLDPCCPPNMPWRTAATMWTRDEDGLARKWYGRFWCNPPYGPPKVIEPWMSRCADHGNGIALIFARTETRCWFRYIWSRATGLMFVEGRPHFYTVDGKRARGNSGGPVALVAYSEQDFETLRRSGIKGKVVGLNSLHGEGQMKEALAKDLRAAVQDLRRTPMPIADVVPLLQRAADALTPASTLDIVEKIRESLRIESIHRDPTPEEIEEYRRFLRLKEVKISDLEHFVSVYQPGKKLREYPGMNIRIGMRVLDGGPHVREQLTELLNRVNFGSVGPWSAHMQYEMLHPFMDGNGRSGRMLWYWMMETLGWNTDIGFLHAFYYQCLRDFERRFVSANDDDFGSSNQKRA